MWVFGEAGGAVGEGAVAEAVGGAGGFDNGGELAVGASSGDTSAGLVGGNADDGFDFVFAEGGA